MYRLFIYVIVYNNIIAYVITVLKDTQYSIYFITNHSSYTIHLIGYLYICTYLFMKNKYII